MAEDQKSLSDALRESEERYRRIYETAPLAFVIWDTNCLITDWNSHAQKIFGWSRDEVLGKDFFTFLVPESEHTPVKGVVDALLQGDISSHVIKRNTTKDGGTILCEWNNAVQRDGAGSVIGVVSLGSDISDLKQMEENLRTSEEKFSKAFNASPASMSIATIRDPRYIEVNEAFQQMWGYTRDEVIGRSVADVGIWPRMEQWEYVARLLEKHGRIRDLELHLRTRTGDDRVVLACAERIELSGEPCVVVIAMDISERKRTEDALRRANAYSRSLREASLDPMVAIGLDGRISDVNTAAELMTGVLRQDLIGTDFSDYFTEPEKARTAYQQAFRNGLVRDYPLGLKHQDGRVASVLYNASVYWDEDGNVMGLFAAARDITARKQAETRLKESEERYRTAVERSNDGFALCGKGKYVYVNQKFLDIFGYDEPGEIIGQEMALVIHPEERDMVKERYEKRIRGEDVPSRYEFRGVRKDGTEVSIEVSAAVTGYQGEQVSLGYMRDITERKEMEDKLRTMSIVDELTGLYNRRGFLTLAQQQIIIAERTRKALELFYIDMDGMKGINDTLGHQEGDNALTDATILLRQTFRKSDIIGRMGGDEFAVLAVDVGGDDGETLVGRLRSALAHHNASENRKYELSFSVGTILFDPENPVSLDELIAGADARMYVEKEGKHRLR